MWNFGLLIPVDVSFNTSNVLLCSASCCDIKNPTPSGVDDDPLVYVKVAPVCLINAYILSVLGGLIGSIITSSAYRDQYAMVIFDANLDPSHDQADPLTL